MTDSLRLVPLGGLSEVGMNCMVLEQADRRVLIDCGLTFPNERIGIDVIHPKLDYLLDSLERLEAIVVTHGHEDHIGAVPFVLHHKNVPVYGPPYALKLIERRLKENPVRGGMDGRELFPDKVVSVGPFDVRPLRVTHSTPDSVGLAIETAIGTVVHSGDFKIDEGPRHGEEFAADAMQQLGDKGVRLLLSDSTNSFVETPGYDEGQVADRLDALIDEAERAVVVCMFASNVHRMAEVVAAAKRTNRRVLLLGRSVRSHAALSAEAGLVDAFGDISPAEARELPRDRVLVIATGSQGEPAAALSRMAGGTHRDFKLEAGDTVLMSSRVIPGYERRVSEIFDTLERIGCIVRHKRTTPDIHCTGHACKDEQRRLIEWLRPEVFLPVHGGRHQLAEHARLARSLDVPQVVTIENGEILELDKTATRVVGHVPSGRVHVRAGKPIADEVLEERRRLGEYGVAMVTLFTKGGCIVQTAGVAPEHEADDLERKVEAAVERAIHERVPRDDDEREELAARVVRREIKHACGSRPATFTTTVRA